MARVVVVGGGFGGTAVAARLAKQRHEVVLLERRDRLGGALGFVERDGYRWDAGPTATALPAVVRDLFRKSGRPLERELDLVPVQPVREHRFTDGTVLALPSGSRGAQLDAVSAALGAPAGRQWVDYVHGFADTWDLLRRSYLERPWSAGHADPAARALLTARVSLRRVVRRAFRDERLRELAWHGARADGHDPRDVPAWVGMWAYVEQNFGVWTVPGGMGLLAAAMTRRLEERRVDVRLGTDVRDLRVEGTRATGVETDHGPVEADVVVVAGDPRRLPALARHVARSSPALPPTVCHLGLTGEVPDLPAEVVLHGDPTLVLRTGGTPPHGASPGAAWTLLVRGRLAEDPLVALARAGIDVRGQLAVRVDRSPRDLAADLAGSPYGTLWQGRATALRKLAPPPYDGLHLTGASAAAGAGLPLVGLSAATVAALVGPAAREVRS